MPGKYERCPKCGNNKLEVFSKNEAIYTSVMQCKGCGEIGCMLARYKNSFWGQSHTVEETICFVCKCKSRKDKNVVELGKVI